MEGKGEKKITHYTMQRTEKKKPEKTDRYVYTYPFTLDFGHLNS